VETTVPAPGSATPPAQTPSSLAPAAGAAEAVAAPVLTDPTLLINRELSWLDFNERVLAQATGGDHPPLDRVRFLAIVATNLEEFFMIRVAALLRKSRAGLDDLSPDGLSTAELLRLVRRRAADMLKRQAACWNDVLKPLLGSHGFRFLDPGDYTPAITDHLQGYFSREVFPALTPLAFDPGHPFPFISSLSDNLAVAVKHAGKTRFARVKVPDALPRFVPIPRRLSPHGDTTFVYLEDVIRANLQALFPGTHVRGSHMFRVVRDADIVIEEDEACRCCRSKRRHPSGFSTRSSRTSKSRTRTSTARRIASDSPTGCNSRRCRARS